MDICRVTIHCKHTSHYPRRKLVDDLQERGQDRYGMRMTLDRRRPFVAVGCIKLLLLIHMCWPWHVTNFAGLRHSGTEQWWCTRICGGRVPRVSSPSHRDCMVVVCPCCACLVQPSICRRLFIAVVHLCVHTAIHIGMPGAGPSSG